MKRNTINMDELIKQAEEGDARAQFRLGLAFIKGDALKRLGVIHSWADLGINHQELCKNTQYRFDESWNELLISFSLLHSGVWLKIKLKE